MITRERIDELLFYANGAFFWRKRKGRSGVTEGARAGYITKQGYRIICLDYKDYFEHNLVWFYENGEWLPSGFEPDHIDRDKANNLISNLRKATRAQNNANQKKRSDNKTGVRGVYFDANRGLYAVQITSKGKTRSLGRFPKLEEAAKTAEHAQSLEWGEFNAQEACSISAET